MGHVATPIATTSTTLTATPTFTFQSAVAAGHTLVGAITCNTGGTPVVSVSDSQGNSYTVHHVVTSGSTAINTLFSGTITTPLTTSDTITIDIGATAHNRWAVIVEEFDDLLPSPFDQSSTATGASTTAFNAGTTPVTTTSHNLVFATYGFGNPAGKVITPATHFSTPTPSFQGTAAGSSDRGVFVQWRYESAAGAKSAPATSNTSTTWAGIVAAFKTSSFANQGPVAHAGSDQVVASNQLVTLDGSGSSDADGSVAAYSWTQTSGPVVELVNDDTANPTFRAPFVTGGANMAFTLTITDDAGDTATDTVTVTVAEPVGHVATPIAGTAITTNSATLPVLSAVPAGHTLIGAVASINPSGSIPVFTVSDTKGNTYTVHATVTTTSVCTLGIFSAELTAALTTSDTLTVSLAGGTYTRWAVTVEQFDNLVSPARDQMATGSGTGTLFDSGTTDVTTSTHEMVFGGFAFGNPAGKTITAGAGYTASAMQGTTVGTSDRGVFAEWKYVNSVGTQNATATSNASTGWAGAVVTFPSQVVANIAPVADAGSDQTVAAQQLVTLGGTSTDTDGSVAEYSWTQLSGPAVTLSDYSAAHPTFLAPTITTGAVLSFGLVVIDNANDESTQDTVTITVNPPVGHVATPVQYIFTETSTKTVTPAPSQAIVPGHVVIGTVVMENGNATSPASYTITDTKNNTYSIISQTVRSGTCTVTVFASRLAYGLETSDTFIITDDVRTHNRWLVTIEEFDNLVIPSIPLDKLATNGDNGTALSGGTTAALSFSNELVFSTFGFGLPDGQSFTAGDTFTTSGALVTAADTNNRGMANQWKYVNAVTAVTPDATLAVTANYGAITATFRSYSITGNTLPVADAGVDQAVTVSTLVTLDGGGSDIDGTIASYAWRQISGPAVSLSSTSVHNPSFTSPAVNTTLVFGLTVTDNLGGVSAEDTVTVIVGDHTGYVSEVLAGTKTSGGTSITLPFLKSVSTGNTILIGVAVETNKGAATFSATDTKGNTYVLDAVSSNGQTIGNGILSCFVTAALTTSDTITITAGGINHNRWAVAGSEFDNIAQNGKDVAAIATGRSTLLDTGQTPISADQYEVAFASFGFSLNNGQVFTPGSGYLLAAQVNAAPGSSNRAVANTYTYFSAPTHYRATGNITAIAMWSGQVVSYAATSLGNLKPLANAGQAQTVLPFSTVTLDGTTSSDQDGTVISYEWQQVSGPTVSLSSATVASPTFIAPGVDGGTSLTFALTVVDNSNDLSAVSTVTITVLSATSFILAGGDWVSAHLFTTKNNSWQ